jgi:chemotaxis signal transduction protein
MMASSPLSKEKGAAMNRDERVSGEQFLVFSLGEEGGYALGDLSHLEVVGLLDIVRPLSQVSISVGGGIQVGEKILPLVDLRDSSGDEDHKYDERACIILLESPDKESPALLGFVVETISV